MHAYIQYAYIKSPHALLLVRMHFQQKQCVHNLHALVFTWSVMEKSHDHVMAGVLRIAGMHAHDVRKSINVKADAVPLIECKMVHCIAQNKLGMTCMQGCKHSASSASKAEHQQKSD